MALIRKVKSYLIHGFIFAVIVTLLEVLVIAILNQSLTEGVKQFSLISFILLWIGGVLLGYLRGKFGDLK